TGEAGRIGLVPEEYATDLAYVYHMVPVAVISHSWEVTVDDAGYRLDVVVNNLGTAPSETIQVLAGFDAGDGRLWNARRSDSFSLEPDESTRVSIELERLQHRRTRVLVYVVRGDRAIDSSRSGWFQA
ncbi:MAG: hypothetical protein ACOC6A_05730, partial [Chloroflexota bacterium]